MTFLKKSFKSSRHCWSIDEKFSQTEQARNQIIAEVKQAYRNYRKTGDLLSVAGRRRSEAQEALRLARERYLNKSGILADWDHAYRAWAEGQVNYWKVDFDHRMAKAMLRMVVGEF